MTNPIIQYWPNGNKELERYIVNGQLHRDPLKGPAIIRYDESGKIIKMVYIINGKRHNPYGPAIIVYIYQWWFDGINYTKEVNEYLNVNRLNYKTMTKIDFDIMWITIL